MTAILSFLVQLIPNLVSDGITGIVSYVWRKKRSKLSPKSKNEKAEDSSSNYDEFLPPDNQKLFSQLRQSTVFFSERFAKAFPGCRDACEFNKRAAMRRLDILLKPPIVARYDDTIVKPVWWWRGQSNLSISSYKRIKILGISTRSFLLSGVELYKISRIIACPSDSYYKNFVYVEVENHNSAGFENLSYSLNKKGWAREEYGVYGKVFQRRVSRHDLDDGATVVRGKPKNLSGKLQLRCAIVGKYNFIIAPHNSPVNYSKADYAIGVILDKMLANQTDIKELIDFVKVLPKQNGDF